MYAKTGEVTLRLTTMAKNESEAEQLLKPLEAKVREVLGEMVYAVGEDNSLAQTVVELLKQHNLKVSFAESCTGGLIASKITNVSGASDVFDCGVVTYSNEMKEKLLGVPNEMLEKFGAVSKEVAEAMAIGVCKLANSNIGVGVTGIAGPNGGTPNKPVGLVYIGICGIDGNAEVQEFNLTGGREIIRERTALYALDMVRRKIQKNT